MVWGAGPMVKFVLLVLLVFSVFSWAIIIYKLRLLRVVEKQTMDFYDLFWEKRHFSQIYSCCKDFNATPLAALFSAAYNELAHAKRAHTDNPWIHPEDIDRLKRVLKKTMTIETNRLEKGIAFLATTGNTAPFVGLFGTVWGIMNSFRGIGVKGAASLAVVAPGISEALIATAMGLFAAIPAVVGYNHILARTGRLRSEMENFSSDILNIVEKKLSRGPGQDTHRDTLGGVKGV